MSQWSSKVQSSPIGSSRSYSSWLASSGLSSSGYRLVSYHDISLMGAHSKLRRDGGVMSMSGAFSLPSCQDAFPSNLWASPGCLLSSCMLHSKQEKVQCFLQILTEACLPCELPGQGTCIPLLPASSSHVVSCPAVCARVPLLQG